MKTQDANEKEKKEFTDLPKAYYFPSDSYEYYDEYTDTFFNLNGDILINIVNYDDLTEGYTPFGDE